jgi:hypothetical protein
MTIAEIEASKKEFLVPTEIAPLLGCDPYSINVQVKADKESGRNSFPFPTILLGTRVKIPRLAFLRAMKGESSHDE